MDITLTIFGQSAAFFVFWWFCSTKVWPLFSNVLEERKQRIADGLEAAARAQKDLELAQNASTDQLREAKEQALRLSTRPTSALHRLSKKPKPRPERRRADHRGSQCGIEQEMNRAREALREQVGAIAVAGAEKILERSIDQAANEELQASSQRNSSKG